MPGRPAADLFTTWSIAPAPALLAGTASVLYAAGVQRLAARDRRWPTARTLSFAGGIVAVLLATQSTMAVHDDRFDVHVLQHVTLGMAAPFLLALGAPVTLALQAGSRRTQVRLVRLLRSGPVRTLSHPVVACGLFALTLFALYFSPVYGWSVRNPFLHEAVHAHFFFVGALFFWVTIGLDPVAWRLPYGVRLGLVLLTVPLHAFLGLALLSTTHPLDGTAGPRSVAVAAQHQGAAIMWIVGDLVGLAAGGVVLVQWMRHEERRGNRIDRRLDDAERSRATTAPGR